MMRVDDHLRLEHSDAETFFLRRAERTEKRLLQEIAGHSATVVGDDKLRPTILVGRLHLHDSIIVDCIGGVEKQVCDHALELLVIREKFWHRLQDFHPLHSSPALELVDRVTEQGIQIDFAWLQFQAVLQRSGASDELIDPIDGAANATQSIRPESRIVEMHRQVG